MGALGDMSKGGCGSSGNNSDYLAEPIQRGRNSGPSQKKKDPYVVRAAERAKKKIQSRISELNEVRLNE